MVLPLFSSFEEHCCYEQVTSSESFMSPKAAGSFSTVVTIWETEGQNWHAVTCLMTCNPLMTLTQPQPWP